MVIHNIHIKCQNKIDTKYAVYTVYRSVEQSWVVTASHVNFTLKEQLHL